MAGGKIDILVEPDVKGFGPKMEAGLRPALGVAGKLGGALGLAFAGAGIAGLGKEIIDVGNTYRTEMNSLQAVTQASGAAMEAAAAKARALGNDMDLPATSAGDAAAAMTELAKGGFTLQESMEAAKGTLQLAAAAQIDAASAATIQSQALQAFGLTADYASTAADVLSGAANASSAEITGIAHGLQQAGTVAHQFGVSMEDTATTLAVFANAGIQGSDAGTLMKSALLALTDQGKPAQAAIEELGLTVYDAHGKFVGMSDLFDQLNLAASRMTDEQYQAATATLFGSDAMRLAGIAAQQGAEGFNRTRSAVTRAGQAAELAAAQTQGLPGAIEMVGNAWEETALGIYTSIEGPLTSGLKGLAEGITGLAPTIADFSATAVGAFADLAGSAAALGGAFTQLPSEVQHLGLALGGLAIAKHTGAIGAFSSKVKSAKSGIAGFRTDIASTRGAFQELGGSISKTSAAMLVLGERVPAIGKMGDAYHGASSKLKTVAAAHREAATAARAQWIAEKDLFTAVDRLGASMGHGAAAKAASFAGTMKGSVAAAISGVKSAAGGLISMLGGPWGAAFLAAGWAVGEVSSELAKARKQQELLREATLRTADSQREMATAIVSGDTAGAIKSMTTALDEFIERQQQLAETKPGKISGVMSTLWEAAKNGGDIVSSAGKTAGNTVIAENAERVSEAFKKVGISSTEMSTAISGSDEKFSALINRFDQTTEGGRTAVAQLKHQRTEWQRINEETKNLAPGALEVSDAFSKIAESSTSAADKVKALNAVLDHMFGQEQSKDDAAAALAEHIDKVSDAAANAVDSADGFGNALLKADGKLDLTQKNARGLRQELIGFRDELANVAATGGDMTEAWSQTQGALDQLAEKYGLTSEQVQDLAASMGLVPSVIETAVNIEADPAKADLATVWAQADQLREKLGQPVEMRVADVEKAINDLSALGLKVDVINAQTGQIKVTADTEQALQNLDMVVTSTASVDQLQAGVKIDIDDQKFRLGAEDVKTLTSELDGLEVSASAQLKIDDLIAGKETSVEELRALSAEVADPKAKMVIDQLIADKTAALGHLNEVAQQNPTPKIGANTSELKSRVGEAMNLINQIPLVRTITLKAIKAGSWLTGHADGGIAGFATGGRLPVYGPGTDRVDGILGVGSDGMPVARVDAGEWVINRRSSEKYHDVLAQINAGTFPVFATGGVIKSADEIKRGIAFMDSTRYKMGGWDEGGVDCSGGVSGTVNVGMGLDFFDSRMSTVTEGKWLDAKGALPGRGGLGDITIGWWDQGGGASGHTALQLQDGTFVESGGNTGGGFTVGKTAGPLEGRGFTDWRHFKGNGEVSESDRTSTIGSSSRGDANWGSAHELHSLAERYVGLYDQGGYLPHGGLALNLSGKPEPVFTAGQWSKMDQLLGLMGKVVQQGSGGLGFLSHSQLVIDAEKGLAETRKSIAEETVDLRKKEEAVADVRKGLTKAEKDFNDLRDKSTDAAKRLEAAERTVVAARFKAAADMVTGVSEALQAGIGHIQKYFSVMGDLAEMVEKTRQEVSKLQMQQTTNRLQLIKSVQDLQVKEWDLYRARAVGAVSVAQAEAELDKARRQQAKLGATSIEAMSGAMDRFRRTGIFSIEEVTASVIENSSAVRAAQWQVEAARAQAAIDELEATHAQAEAQLQVAEATLAQNAAAEMLRLNTAALTEQARELYGMTANQARGAAAGFGGIGRVVGGLGKVLGGILSGLAGFAVGGPVGALAGAGMAVGGISDIARGSIDIRNNKGELSDAWKGMSVGDRVALIAGSAGGAALSIGGGALAGQLGPDAAVGGAKLADQWMDATIGSMAYSVESKIAAMQRRQADKQSALSTAIEAQKLQLEAKKLSAQTEHAAKADALKAQLDYAQLQKQLAEASTKREAEALAKAAEVAAQRREAMLVLAQRQTAQQDETNRQLALLVEAQRAAAKKAGINTSPVEFTLPEGDAFTRGQTEAMLREVRDEYERRIAALTQVDANRFVDSKIG
ncbi:phage tail tape measure protein [Corynebacterium rouxii]|uniref:Phage tail tape measure protein n=1 Tax=Corynebacterium rouxii TaxID=2719119 RepID=A0A6I8MD51_9CORY|nr:phage tail tape measure protein [Corynebacterium rouxii]VZH84186.1 phage tail tape measure protein [Corynebacterium rouxii]